jgi:mannose-6-phosphate isomerase-like protein (cupin superfamily)
MSDIFNISDIEWKPVRPEIANGVYSKTMLEGKVKSVLTRVAPGGTFQMHADAYSHLFYFLSGEGVVQIGEKKYEASAGIVVQIDSGEMHSYENTGEEDLILISLNILQTGQ